MKTTIASGKNLPPMDMSGVKLVMKPKRIMLCIIWFFIGWFVGALAGYFGAK